MRESSPQARCFPRNMKTFLLGISTLSLFTSACAGSPPPARAATTPPRQAEINGTLSFVVSRENDQAILSGRSDINRGKINVEATERSLSHAARLELSPFRSESGEVLIEAHYAEESPEHDVLKWNTVVRVKPGADTFALVSTERAPRRLRLHLE
jgi:hypothetical protein